MSFRYWNQYGFETDVFDKYRDSLLKTNRNAVMVLGWLGVAVSVAVSLFMAFEQRMGGLVFCVFLFLCGAVGIFAASRK